MAYREFEDDAGASWRVWDTYPQSSTRTALAGLQGGWLTFEHDAARRRLVPAPSHWADAPDEILRRWLVAATPVTIRIRDLAEEVDSMAEAAQSSRAAGAAATEPRVPEETRQMIARSRETLDLLDRAIRSGGEWPADAPSAREPRAGDPGSR